VSESRRLGEELKREPMARIVRVQKVAREREQAPSVLGVDVDARRRDMLLYI
jgi:hypothetical protein